MKRLTVLLAALFVFLVRSGLPVMAQDRAGVTADLVLVNATVHTMSRSLPLAEGVAVVGGRIAAVGTNEAIEAWIGLRTRIIDATGLTITPGFIESHGHLMGIGWSEKYLDLSYVGSYDELIRMVAEAVRKAQPGEWIMGGGWHQSKWSPAPVPAVRGYPVHEALSRISTDNPVFLSHASGHAAMANARAMDIAGIGPGTRFSEGGEILKDANGNPTGIFVEAAQGLIAAHVPPLRSEQAARMLELAVQECLKNGITSFQDAGVDRPTLALLQSFAGSGKLNLRVYAMLIPGRDGGDQAFVEEWLQRGPQIGLGGGFLTIRTVKLMVDGALGSRGAWLLEPYSDDPGNSGHTIMPMEAAYQVSKQALEAGFQVATHAIGDRANHEILNVYERVFSENPLRAKDARFRIEHAQHIAEQDIHRFAGMGVIAAMQGIHMASDISWAIDRLGPERIEEGAYVWQKLLRSGAVVTNGTDAPVEPVNPLDSFFASVTRKTLEGTLFPWSHPEQRMTREQALRSYTIDAAYASFEEDIKGSIEPGKLADLTVFSQDLMKIPVERILDTEVVYTIVGGKVLYQRGER
ncbi:MAG: amidohydrolase [Spirochaetaceae bacterium]|nr:MAG: amidohydrolase [Spirochaetaceae bacterium]